MVPAQLILHSPNWFEYNSPGISLQRAVIFFKLALQVRYVIGQTEFGVKPVSEL